ncbi:MAG: nitroreductase family protein [Methanosphaera stadtmanae]|nr:nitroreductase family protein [Methanosphaera stadtmanae]
MNNSEIILENINKRCSTRVFNDKKISLEDLKTIIKSAFCAPSATNLQPWEYIIITDYDKVRDMRNIHPYAAMFETASSGIIVCGNLNKVIPNYEEFWIQDCSAATQNILLAANALGISSVWTGIYPVEERCDKLKEYFCLPENIMPFALIALGYCDKEANIIDKYDEKKIHMNDW